MPTALTQFSSRNNRSTPRLLLALAFMFASAYCFFAWMGAVSRISGWIGLPQHASQIPRLESETSLWSALAIALPLAAALLLSFGKATSDQRPSRNGSATSLTYQAQSPPEKILAPLLRYLGYLIISLIGTLGFVVVLFLFGLLLHKHKVRPG
jgi:hypothetical protein